MINKVVRESEENPVRWLLHLGDFSIWPGQSSEDYVDAVEVALDEANIRILITPGNHENWGWLRPAFKENGYRNPIMVRDHIAVLPPGFRFTVRTAETERTFLSLGGAPSVDRHNRIMGETWWQEEEITASDAGRAADGGFADVMLAQDAPNNGAPAVQRIISSPGGWPVAALQYAAHGRWRMSVVYSEVLPDLFLHGHYHVFDDAIRPHREAGAKLWSAANPNGTTRFVSLACDDLPGNTVLLRVGSLEITRVELWT